MTTIDWGLINSFIKVAELGSLTKAAQALGKTQPTVGRHIQDLESCLDATLFDRLPHGLQLTERGLDLLSSAREMESAATDFERIAAGKQETIAGTIRLSVNEVFGVLVMPGLLTEFRAHHPEINIEMVVSNQVSNLLRREADLAVRMVRPTQNDLIAKKISELEIGFYGHHDYIEKFGAPISWEEITGHALIGFDQDTLMLDAARNMGIPISVNNFTFRCDSILAQMAAVRAGMGLGGIQVWIAKQYPELQRIAEDLPIPPLELWLAAHKDLRHNKRIRLLTDFLAERLKRPTLNLV